MDAFEALTKAIIQSCSDATPAPQISGTVHRLKHHIYGLASEPEQLQASTRDILNTLGGTFVAAQLLNTAKRRATPRDGVRLSWWLKSGIDHIAPIIYNQADAQVYIGS